jgi:hypothetical protein
VDADADAAIVLVAEWLGVVHVESAPGRVAEMRARSEAKDRGDRVLVIATADILLRNAHHEAAHAVVGHKLGRRVTRACVRADGSGIVELEPEDEADTHVAFCAAIGDLAGPCAELHLGVDDPRRHELAHSADVLAAKLNIARYLAGEPECPPTNAFFAKASFLAVLTHWRSIQRIANCLRAVEEHELSGLEVAALCARPNLMLGESHE